MSLFICEKCGCVENTALCNYWNRSIMNNGKALCSECETGKWHNCFPKRKPTLKQLKNERAIIPEKKENMINQQKLNDLITKHKKLMGVISNNYKGCEDKLDEINPKDTDIIGKIGKTGKIISLVVSNFKCQKCGNENELTLHHLIMRKAQEYMGFWRYASQRYYWANMIILCKNCHKNYHGIMKEQDDDMLVITQKVIDKLKKQFELK